LVNQHGKVTKTFFRASSTESPPNLKARYTEKGFNTVFVRQCIYSVFQGNESQAVFELLGEMYRDGFIEAEKV